MSDSARDQVARLLRLVPLLHARDGLPLDEAARVLGVPEKQVVADLKVLFLCGLPGGFPDDLIDVDLDALERDGGDAVVRVGNAEYLSRPLRLTPTEATALIVALRALHGAADATTREIVERTVAKLERAAASGTIAAEVAAGDAAPPVAALRLDLERAVAEGRQVRLRYYVPSRDEESERVVDPRAVTSAQGAAYLDAWCHSADAPRLFRLDRIHEAQVLDTPVVADHGPPVDLEDRLFVASPDTPRVTLALDPAAAWVTEYYPVEGVRTRPDGDLEVDLVVLDDRWLERLLLRVAPHARVVGPSEWVDRVERRFSAVVHETLGLYPAHTQPGPRTMGTKSPDSEDE